MRRSQRWLVAGVAVVAFAATACGSSSSKKSSAKTTTTEAAATSTTVKFTGDPIKLMVIYEKTAGVAQPDQAKGAIAAAKEITANGGIDGHPVDVTECDTKNDPNTAADCGRQAVSDKVAAVVGQFSVQSGEFMPLLVQNKIASIGLNPATASDFTSLASFPITGGAPSTFGTLPVALAELGATKIALAACRSRRRRGVVGLLEQGPRVEEHEAGPRRRGSPGRARHVELRRRRARGWYRRRGHRHGRPGCHQLRAGGAPGQSRREDRPDLHRDAPRRSRRSATARTVSSRRTRSCRARKPPTTPARR